ncbi:N-acetyltransferase 8 [Ornithorhynchus anatinus]|uniref:N-acetyltransferase 8 n=1 Tax=Ornithorhynchus anatinus TaxID=9258 RepID=UPI0010A92852|nr:N-acetyltransferase 8 [Ornithorhynchus anatinus]
MIVMETRPEPPSWPTTASDGSGRATERPCGTRSPAEWRRPPLPPSGPWPPCPGPGRSSRRCPVALFAATGSILLALAAPPVLLAALREFLNRHWRDCVEKALRTDLKDIRRSYPEAEGCGFWVAESAGRVAGLVAARPAPDPSGGRRMQLLRMSVGKDHRGRGMAQAPVRTVLRFARDRGCDAVVLNTSCVQYRPRRLYRSMGFRKMSEEIIPTLAWKVIGLCGYKYICPLPPSP